MVKTMLNIYVILLGIMMIFGKGTGEIQKTDDNDFCTTVHVKSRNYSKEEYLYSSVLSNGDFVVVTQKYDDDYRIIQEEGKVGLKAEFDSKSDVHIYVDGEELTEDRVRNMNSADIRIYSDFLRDMSNNVIRH